MTDKRPAPQINPAVVELQALRHDLTALKDEVSGLRKDVKEKNLVDQIAKGVALAMLFWAIVWVVVGGLFAVLFSR
jgi:hypothetical protein